MIDFKMEYNNKIKENVGKVVQELDTPEMILKIKNWTNRFSCDGEYCLQKDTQINCMTRIERLNKMCGKTSFAMQINELKEFLSKFNC